MHFEILVEDASGKIALESIMHKILAPDADNHSFRIISYRGIGRIPKDLKGNIDPRKRILLDRLPKLLNGYGKSLQDMDSAVVLVVDLDNKNCLMFKEELVGVLKKCNPQPNTLFRIAIEEGEAWLMGDAAAIKAAYPDVKNEELKSYVQDSICGTWEKLADAIYKGGSRALKNVGWPHTGQVKCDWARNISPYMDVENNQSKSFQVFRDGVRNLAGV